jgi:hypothetical protein
MTIQWLVKSDNSLWTWGSNYTGQCGDGTLTLRTAPVKVMDNVTSVASGWSHSFAIKTDKSLWGWGTNYDGQLGIGEKGYYESPVTVKLSIPDVSSISMLTLPTKTSYLFGEALNLTGAKLNVFLKDGTTKTANITSSMVSGYNPKASVYGPQTVSVVYYGSTFTTFQVSLDRFSDVPYGHRNYAHINALVELGIINGYSDSTFRPNNTLTRAQAAIMIVRAAGISTEGVSSSLRMSHRRMRPISLSQQRIKPVSSTGTVTVPLDPMPM